VSPDTGSRRVISSPPGTTSSRGMGASRSIITRSSGAGKP